jgi:Arc/MetJ-type ribon-helix-helix transcriptional regulator
MYGMQKITVYLPDELKRSLARAAVASGCSEAKLIREALQALTEKAVPPRPRLPLFASGKSRLDE